MLCRDYVLNHCSNKERCKLEHPNIITPTIRQKCLRDIGRCYCGCSLKTIFHRYKNNALVDNEEQIFSSVCSRTNKSIERCRIDLNSINQ